MPSEQPVAVVETYAAGAFGAMWAQADLRKVLAAIGARVVEGEVVVGHADTRFDEHGRLIDEKLAEQLAEVVDGLIAAARGRIPQAARRLEAPTTAIVRALVANVDDARAKRPCLRRAPG